MKSELLLQTGFYQLRSKPLARKRCINMFPLVSEDESFSKVSLMGCPGIPLFKDTGIAGKCRGKITVAGVPYFVIGNSFISLTADGTVTNHGTISGTEDVSMDYNTKTICIIDPYGDGYFFTVATATLAQITDASFLDYGQVRTVNYKKGFFVYNTDTEFFVGSHYDVNNGQDFDATDFDVEDTKGDNIVATFTSRDQLYVLGSETTAVFDNIETTLFPFAEITGANFEVGCFARLSLVKFDNDFLMIGGGKNENPSIFRITNSTPVRISTDAVDYVLSLATAVELERATADTFSIDGHVFAVFHVGDYTLVYDETSSRDLEASIWHERQSGYTNGESFKPWRGVHATKAFGRILIGDKHSGNVGYLDMDTYTEFGERIERVIISQPIDSKGSALFQRWIEMFIEAGVGNADSDDPEWHFSYTDDGKQWSEPRARKMGKVGEYRKRLIWRRLGRIPYSRALRWKTDDPVKIAIYKWVSEIA